MLTIEENIKAIAKNNKLIGRVEGLMWVLDHLEQGIDGEYLEYCIVNHMNGVLEEHNDE